MHKATDTSEKVMNRIMNENKWAMPVHKQESKISKRFQRISLVISILILVGISVSFIYISPKQTSQKEIEYSQSESIVTTTIRATDFAKSFSNLDFVEIHDGVIASIGEPRIYQPKDEKNSQAIIMLAILGISMITLFLSWLSSEKD